MVVHSINKKTRVSTDNVNLVKDINGLRSLFNESKLEYYNMLVNMETDDLIKRAHMKR